LVSKGARQLPLILFQLYGPKYIRFAEKQKEIAKKTEDTTDIGLSLISASEWIPLGGSRVGVLDSCSGVSSNRVEDIIDLRSINHTGRSTDASYKEPEMKLFF